MTERRILDAGATEAEAELLRAARSYRVSEKARQRTLAAIAATALVPSSARATSSAWSAKTKLVAGLLSCGIVAGLLAWTTSRNEVSGSSNAPSMQSIAAIESLSLPTKTETPPEARAERKPEVDLPSTPVNELPSAAIAKSSAAPSARVVADDTEELAAELAGLDRVKRATERGDGVGAIALLDAHDARFRNGRLVPEATVLRIEALLSAGDRASAKKLAATFLERHPKSPLTGRVHTLVDGDAR
jgi:hypothetical protein